MTAPLFGTPETSVWGFGSETTAGTPVAVTDYIPITPGQNAPKFAAGRKAIEVAMGSPNPALAVIDGKGAGSWSVVMKLYHLLGAGFLTNCGLTAGGIIAPAPTTIQVNSGGRSTIYPGCRCTKAVLAASIDNDLMVTLTGIFTARPTDDVLLSAPSVTGEDPFAWVDAGQFTLLSGASTASDAESVQITVDMPHGLGYGNSGAPLANIVKLSKIVVSGQIQVYFNDTNIAEWRQAVTANGVDGALSIPFTKASTSHSITLALPHAKYGDVDLPMQTGSIDLLTLPILSYSPTLGNQLTMTAA